MSIKHRLQQTIYSILKHNRDGSYETQASRKKILFQAAKELVSGPFRRLADIRGLKQKHIKYLNERWQQNNLNVGTIKNRNSHLRWLCEKLGKANVILSNEQLNTGNRRYVNNHINKAIDIHKIDLAHITHPRIVVQIHLQRYLGLRREESCKLKPHQADKKTYLDLKSSWCKGGRARTVPILTPEARYWLDEAKKLVSTQESLIPTDKTYIQHRDLYDNQMKRAGIKHAHGFRHAYAQERYQQLTGWDCPKCGGPTASQLTPEQKKIDREARLIISEELGHSRIQIMANYCGR